MSLVEAVQYTKHPFAFVCQRLLFSTQLKRKESTSVFTFAICMSANGILMCAEMITVPTTASGYTRQLLFKRQR